MLRQSVRESVAVLHPGWPDDSWSDSWPQSWNVLAEQGWWSTLDPSDGLTVELAPCVSATPGVLLIAARGSEAVFSVSGGDATAEVLPTLDVSRRIVALGVAGRPVAHQSPHDAAAGRVGRTARSLLYCVDHVV